MATRARQEHKEGEVATGARSTLMDNCSAIHSSHKYDTIALCPRSASERYSPKFDRRSSRRSQSTECCIVQTRKPMQPDHGRSDQQRASESSRPRIVAVSLFWSTGTGRQSSSSFGANANGSS